MSKDGRKTIRFGGLLDEIERLARLEDRDPSDWVRLQIRRIIRKRRRAEESKAKAAARD